MRTCVGCRERVAKHDLLRVVLVQDKSATLAPDPQGRAPGRGAHLHPTRACLDLAERRRAFTRALRANGPVDLDALRRYVEAVSASSTTEKESGSSGS
ncbi:YlxR family protein [Tenggerimyces flavus]|uniref:YlxR family protein n=1 Tax=Tenggerimyces flavus TaxID=1708749 RepID=A0ABV7YB67_9ACTN|nr:YlxR family protein [Tenggerimyces flavus]